VISALVGCSTQLQPSSTLHPHQSAIHKEAGILRTQSPHQLHSVGLHHIEKIEARPHKGPTNHGENPLAPTATLPTTATTPITPMIVTEQVATDLHADLQDHPEDITDLPGVVSPEVDLQGTLLDLAATTQVGLVDHLETMFL
jgi:hypothetical protein